MTNIDKIRYRTEKLPPEGGWSYLATSGLGLSLGICWGSYACFSLLFNDFVKSVGGGTSAFTIVMGFVNVALSISALCTGTLTKYLSLRTTAILGATLICLSNVMSLFATSVVHLIITFGIFLGSGMGFMLPTAFAIFNGYFVKKRVMMMSYTQSINGAIMMAYPLMVQYLLNEFDYRGALAVIAAINANAVLGMLLMQPVEWHQRKVKVPIGESQPFLDSNVTKNGKTIAVASENGNVKQSNGCNGAVEEKIPLEVISEVPHQDKSNGDSKSIKSDHRASTQTLHDDESLHRRLSIASILGNSPVILSNNIEPRKKGACYETHIFIAKTIVDFLDLTHLKDIVYVNIVLGLTFAHFADGYFFILEPVYLLELKISKDDTALIMAITALFDLISRIFLSIVSLFFTFKARYIYTAGARACILSRFAFLQVTLVFLPTPLVLAEYLSKERFTSGYGLYLFIQGVLSFLLSPLIGWVRDTTKSYEIFFHTLSFIMGMCAVPWLIELVWFKMYPRKAITSNEKLNQKE